MQGRCPRLRLMGQGESPARVYRAVSKPRCCIGLRVGAISLGIKTSRRELPSVPDVPKAAGFRSCALGLRFFL